MVAIPKHMQAPRPADDLQAVYEKYNKRRGARRNGTLKALKHFDLDSAMALTPPFLSIQKQQMNIFQAC